jgi:uncharacterized protein with HEPN domain
MRHSDDTLVITELLDYCKRIQQVTSKYDFTGFQKNQQTV